jgi:dTDP-glucose 4,6-dehydratase
MKILVTGGCGFIGSEFVNYVYKNFPQYTLVVVDKLTYAGDVSSIPSDVELIKKDICDLTFEDVGEFNYCVNFAAESHVDNSIKDGSPFVKTNVMGTFNMLELSKKCSNFIKFVQISTDEVYGDLDIARKGQSRENDRLIPSSYYSATKAAADELVIACTHTYGLPTLITRTCNNFGVKQHSEKFLPTIMNSILNEIEIPIYGDGKQVREWIWVNDNVRMIFDLMLSEHGIYNIGSGDVWQNIQIIEFINRLIGVNAKYTFVNDRLGHDRRYTLDSDKLQMYYKKNKLTKKSLFQYLKEQFNIEK